MVRIFFYDKMPTRCVANECENTTDANKKTAAQIELEKVMKVTFHSFPADPVRRAEWIRILKLEDKNINSRSRLCSLHFKEEYIDRTSLVYVRLRENAIPHIFENTLCDEMEDETVSIPTGILNIKMENGNGLKQTSVISLRPIGFKLPNVNVESGHNLKQTSATYLKCDKETSTSPFLLQRTRNPTQDKETRISPERIWNMNLSNIEAIRKAKRIETENLRKKIKVLQQKVTRKDKKIAIMKTILDELKIENIISDSTEID